MRNEGDPIEKNNGHYSEQNAHALRGVHARVVKILGGIMPEGVSGYNGIEDQRVRRHVRKPHPDGKR